MTETNTDTAVDDQKASEEHLSDSDRLLAHIPSIVGDEETLDDGGNAAPDNDSNTENQTADEKKPDASADGEPADQEGKPAVEGKEEETEGDKGEADADKSEESDKTEEEKAAEAEAEEKEAQKALMADLLGIKPEDTTDDPEILRKRHSDATRHIGELEDQIRGINEALSAQGRQLIQTADGMKVAATEDAKELSNEIVDVNAIYKSLKPAEQDLLTEDGEAYTKLIAEKVRDQFVENFMPEQASVKDITLTDREADAVYDDFINAKLADGTTPRYKNATDPEVEKMMQNIFASQDPAMQKFMDAASRDKEMSFKLLEYGWLKAFHARSTMLAMMAEKKKATETKNKEIAAETTISTQGASQAAKGQDTSGKTTDSVQSRFEQHLKEMDL